ncbi:dimethylarginine dimethylaminohydrolase family protein [Mongoliimonas terrestris]|uniref:dimethylarginine dimethylaminohydrolase family protein n=1 Tax=Mongoliimonas terrestris TaxID=1709001 RepID=UPI00094974B9|nr:arginine deiminase family protein [Mongoliimonas terrestris]
MPTSAFAATRFDHALTRAPAASAVNGLRAVDRGAPDVAALAAEHAAYVATLRRLGLTVDVLPALEAYPDSVFVEDPALVFPEGAVLLRPGAPTRLGETAEIAPVLRERFGRVIDLPGTGYADGGDVLVTARHVYIGLSARTDAAGARALAGVLADLGHAASPVAPPAGVLHLKTGCSLLDEETVLATEAVAAAGLFDGLETVVVPAGEEPVANALSVNGTVLIAAGFPRTADLLAARGLTVETLVLDEVMKLDAGLSCMSLRWMAG